MFSALYNALRQFASSTVEWVLNGFMWLLTKTVVAIFFALVKLLKAIPVPDWLNSIGPVFGAVTPYVWFFARVAEFEFGFAIFLPALILRFIIRRLPFVG